VSTEPQVRVEVLGPTRLHRGGQISAEAFERPQVRALLGYLAIHHPRAVPTSEVVEALWPQAGSIEGSSLYTTVSRLRRVLGREAVVKDGMGYRLGPGVEVDIRLFDAALAADPLRIKEALDLYRGDLLADLPLAEWSFLARETYRNRFLEAATRYGESLLAQERSADGFLAKPAMEMAGKGLGIGDSGLDLIGRQIGGYQMLSRLGAGGMGEVYRARDLKLGRDVAIKVLPSSFAADPERLRRFEREARLLASLNHPHIGAIHGFVDADGVQGLVLELVEGPTLADRIARGPAPIAEALTIAGQIAEALEAAHEKWIIHRDLKPANIKLTRDGDAKVLDFGLAKAFAADESGPDFSRMPTVTATELRTGAIVGTPTYMSPEQARGQTLDKRTDI
jgi:hypothetical protein